MSPTSTLLDLTDFVRGVRLRKDREAATQRAIEQAKNRSTIRQQFRPFIPEAPKPIKLRF
jgi:hypothetical protein